MGKAPRSHLSCALALVLGLASAIVGRADDAPVADPDPSRFEAEIKAFEAWDRQNSFPPHAVLFVGSSSIRKWQTAEGFPDLPVINRGFGGSHVSEVNHFVERIVFKYSPRVIVFYAGDNDIADGKSPERVFHDFQTFAELVHGRLPETRLIYLPIKPSLARWNKWPRDAGRQFARGEVRSRTGLDHLSRHGDANAGRRWPAESGAFRRRRAPHECRGLSAVE